ncbi:MAG: TOBE domain-containing protein [Campylobacter sp.]|nr:TOBE domain-containing protein [Campylobacter sp.]
MIKAVVKSIDVADEVNFIKFDANGIILSMLSLENLGLSVGEAVELAFKSSDVFLSLLPLHACSVRNEISCVISEILLGEVVACIHLKTENFEFESIISANSCRELELCVGKEIYAHIKSTSLYIC